MQKYRTHDVLPLASNLNRIDHLRPDGWGDRSWVAEVSFNAVNLYFVNTPYRQADPIELREVLANHRSERRRMANNDRIHSNHRIGADLEALMDDTMQAKIGMVTDMGMASHGGDIGHLHAVAVPAVVGDMSVRHNVPIVADTG